MIDPIEGPIAFAMLPKVMARPLAEPRRWDGTEALIIRKVHVKAMHVDILAQDVINNNSGSGDINPENSLSDNIGATITPILKNANRPTPNWNPCMLPIFRASGGNMNSVNSTIGIPVKLTMNPTCLLSYAKPPLLSEDSTHNGTIRCDHNVRGVSTEHLMRFYRFHHRRSRYRRVKNRL